MLQLVTLRLMVCNLIFSMLTCSTRVIGTMHCQYIQVKGWKWLDCIWTRLHEVLEVCVCVCVCVCVGGGGGGGWSSGSLEVRTILEDTG